MKKLGKEILEELKTVLAGQSLDAILPPLVYAIVNGLFGLTAAVLSAGSLSLLFVLFRTTKKQNLWYALGGLIGILVAGGLALLANRASNYFLPGIVTNALVLVLAVFSLIVDRPMAAYASHLTRGWTLSWFWLKSIKPAYREVTVLWTLYFLMRTVIQVTLYLQSDISTLAFTNFLMGTPVMIVVLVLSYLYGIWRLRMLKGPGIDEYDQGKPAPYRGQTRGF